MTAASRMRLAACAVLADVDEPVAAALVRVVVVVAAGGGSALAREMIIRPATTMQVTATVADTVGSECLSWVSRHDKLCRRHDKQSRRQREIHDANATSTDVDATVDSKKHALTSDPTNPRCNSAHQTTAPCSSSCSTISCPRGCS